MDSLGTCKFTVNTHLYLVCRALNAVTGWDYTAQEAMTFWKRCHVMLRLFRLRSGVGVELERPSERYWSTPVDGPAAGTSAKENWETLIDAFYETVGMDRKSGKPFPDTMRRVGLEDMIPEVWSAEEAEEAGVRIGTP